MRSTRSIAVTANNPKSVRRSMNIREVSTWQLGDLLNSKYRLEGVTLPVKRKLQDYPAVSFSVTPFLLAI